MSNRRSLAHIVAAIETRLVLHTFGNDLNCDNKAAHQQTTTENARYCAPFPLLSRCLACDDSVWPVSHVVSGHLTVKMSQLFLRVAGAFRKSWLRFTRQMLGLFASSCRSEQWSQASMCLKISLTPLE